MSFKVGDRVRATTYIESRIPEGSEGVVCDTDTGEGTVGVEWEKFDRGHSCCGNCRDGRGWYTKVNHLQLVIPVLSPLDQLLASIEEAEHVIQDR
ncbi:hypothetical protein UFOVP706_34 [uncultured Caudovirales phage]|uniref:Uncharacterized protein n=1 Tax=uncultured Caudovirales phage TaxID=2100421 RepID=A0A6J5NHS9_9CAUD|nr:hypothetical protein UFOVP706_34 [uncultured Caudovirales phage]